MDDSIQILLLLKELIKLIKLQDIVQYIMKIYIFIIPPGALAGELFFKCSCQRMTRMIDYSESNPLVYKALATNKMIFLPEEEISFYDHANMDLFYHPMRKISKEEKLVHDQYQNNYYKCEYCDAIWVSGMWDSPDAIGLKSEVMILCECGEFSKNVLCGGANCILKKCEFKYCEDKTTRSPTICDYHYICDDCDEPYTWSVSNKNPFSHTTAFSSTCFECGNRHVYNFSENILMLPILFPKKFIYDRDEGVIKR